MQFEQWRQATDVALKTVTHRGTTRTKTPPAIGWHVVNLSVEGRTFRYRVTTNVDAHGPEGPGAPPIWAINLHGYFAGGSMYARESEKLAAEFGWRVVNPSLPGFGGSDPLDMSSLSIETLADHVELVCADLGITTCVLLGHSMGGAVAVEFARRRPERVLGLIYRDGVATPEWANRHGLVAKLVNPFLPDMAPVVDIMAAVALDVPDLLFGHVATTLKALWPDLKTNSKTMAKSIPVASLLFELDLTDAVRDLAAAGVPLYPVWGCFDRVVTSDAAEGFARASGTSVQWVPGGHSWMLARPSGQRDLLCAVESGQHFLAAMTERRIALTAPKLRRVV